MSRSLLVVAGSRALAATAESREWATTVVSARVSALSTRDVVLVCGSEVGEYAIAAARIWQRRWLEVQRGGLVVSSWRPEERWHEGAEAAHPHRAFEHALERAALARDAGWSVAVLVLRADGSLSDGCGYLASRARTVGLPTTVLVHEAVWGQRVARTRGRR